MVTARVLYILLVGASSLLPLLVLDPLLQNRDKPGATGLLITVPSVSLWSLGLAATMAATTPWQWFLAATLTILVTQLTVVGWVLTAGEYAGLFKPTKRIVGGLLVFPLFFQLVAWTNPLHHLLFPPLSTVALGEPIRIPMDQYPLLAGHTLASYLFFLAGFLIIVRDALRARGIRRRQALLLVASGFLPFVPNILYIADLTRFQLTPLGFVGALFVLGWALFRADFLDVVPVGRSLAVESMEDPVVTLDGSGYVVDSNPAARELVGAESNWEGLPAAEFFEGFPAVSEFLDGEDYETEISLSDRGKQRHFVLNCSPIFGLQDEQRGTLIVLQEFTELKEREQDLDLLRQVQSRVLRHNIRNELEVLRGHSELIAEEFDDEYGEMAEQMVETTADLVSVSNKARSVEKLVEHDQTPVELDLETTLSKLLDQNRSEFPAVAFSLESPENAVVETIPAIELALGNLIENGAEHNDTADPTVDVTVDYEDDEAVVTVTDNGPGIPEYEIAVIEQKEETALEHGSGVGMWVIDWVVENSTASVDFEFTGTGAAATVRIPRDPQDVA